MLDIRDAFTRCDINWTTRGGKKIGRSFVKASLKNAIQTAGIDGEPTMLLLEEHHMREKGMSILISAVVANGELPGLFSTEELDAMITPLIDFPRRDDLPGTWEQYFYYRE